MKNFFSFLLVDRLFSRLFFLFRMSVIFFTPSSTFQKMCVTGKNVIMQKYNFDENTRFFSPKRPSNALRCSAQVSRCLAALSVLSSPHPHHWYIDPHWGSLWSLPSSKSTLQIIFSSYPTFLSWNKELKTSFECCVHHRAGGEGTA
jgi:hypothetical protein